MIKIPTLKMLVQVLGGLCLYGWLAAPASAVTNTWDSSGVGSVTDGSGTWSTGNANWWNGTTDVVWPNGTGDAAIIGNANGAAGTITVSGTLNVNTLIFSPASSGNYTISGGTLTLSGTTPTISNNANATISSAVVGTAGLVKTGTGMLSLSGSGITYSGNTTVNNGTLSASGMTADFSVQNGTLTVSGSGTFVGPADPVWVNIGNSSGPGTLTITNNGTVQATRFLIARTANAGTVNMNGGTFTESSASDNSYIGFAGPATWIQTAGVATFNTTHQLIMVNSGDSGAATLNVSGGSFGQVNSAGYFEVGGSGTGLATLTITNNGIVTSAGTFSVGFGSGSKGIVNLDGGTLRIGTLGVIASGGTGTISFNGGTFQASGNMAIANSANLHTIVNAGGAVMDTSNFTMTVNNPLTDGGSGGGLAKDGTGTLILNGTNTYTGSTILNAGALIVNGSLANNSSSNVFVTVGGNVFNSATPTLIRNFTNAIFSITPFGSQELGSFGTKADLVDSAPVSGIMTMQWRTANSAIDVFPTSFGLGSDVLRLGGVNGTNFVLQMSYNSGSYTQVAATGALSLDWFNGSIWTNAVAGNAGGTANFAGVQAYNSSLFSLGTWGVDTNAGVVWAVVNHSGDFAVVVPEPSAFVLLFLGCGALAIGRRRQI